MPRVIETAVFQYDELDESSKERARAWYRDGGFDHEWWDFVYEDAALIAELMGLDVRLRQYKKANGGIGAGVSIYFSGFCSQGDGACFDGNYAFRADSVAAVKAHAPTDPTLHAIVEGLAALQAANGNGVRATVRQSGRYSHEYCTAIDVEILDSDGTADAAPDETADAVSDLLRDFMRWIYCQLESTWDAMNSDESVADDIRANGYGFTAFGKVA